MDLGRISASFIPSLFSPFTHSVCQSLPYFLTLSSPSVHDDTFRRYHTPLTVEDRRGRGCTVNRAAHVASIKLISVESSPPHFLTPHPSCLHPSTFLAENEEEQRLIDTINSTKTKWQQLRRKRKDNYDPFL